MTGLLLRLASSVSGVIRRAMPSLRSGGDGSDRTNAADDGVSVDVDDAATDNAPPGVGDDVVDLQAIIEDVRDDTRPLDDFDAVDMYGLDCPVCGEEIERGSVRFTGYAWEHKDPTTHPQAGHHVLAGDDVRRMARDEHGAEAPETTPWKEATESGGDDGE